MLSVALFLSIILAFGGGTGRRIENYYLMLIAMADI